LRVADRTRFSRFPLLDADAPACVAAGRAPLPEGDCGGALRGEGGAPRGDIVISFSVHDCILSFSAHDCICGEVRGQKRGEGAATPL